MKLGFILSKFFCTKFANLLKICDGISTVPIHSITCSHCHVIGGKTQTGLYTYIYSHRHRPFGILYFGKTHAGFNDIRSIYLIYVLHYKTGVKICISHLYYCSKCTRTIHYMRKVQNMYFFQTKFSLNPYAVHFWRENDYILATPHICSLRRIFNWPLMVSYCHSFPLLQNTRKTHFASSFS